MDVKPIDVKRLREKTGAGMLDCKSALIDAEGDFDRAVKLLREQGLAAANRRSGRATNEGRVFTLVKGDTAGVLELSCETDFVAINEVFVKAGEELVEGCIDAESETLTTSLEERLKETIATVKENIEVRRVKLIKAGEGEFLVDYLHGNGKIGVLVKLATKPADLIDRSEVKELGFDIALHVAAFNPVYLSKERVDPSYLKEQEEIMAKQVEGMDKPQNVLDGIIKGKLSKYLSSICLLEQGFVKDEKKPTSSVVSSLAKELGGEIEVLDFVNFKQGDSL